MLLFSTFVRSYFSLSPCLAFVQSRFSSRSTHILAFASLWLSPKKGLVSSSHFCIRSRVSLISFWILIPLWSLWSFMSRPAIGFLFKIYLLLLFLYIALVIRVYSISPTYRTISHSTMVHCMPLLVKKCWFLTILHLTIINIYFDAFYFVLCVFSVFLMACFSLLVLGFFSADCANLKSLAFSQSVWGNCLCFLKIIRFLRSIWEAHRFCCLLLSLYSFIVI